MITSPPKLAWSTTERGLEMELVLLSQRGLSSILMVPSGHTHLSCAWKNTPKHGKMLLMRYMRKGERYSSNPGTQVRRVILDIEFTSHATDKKGLQGRIQHEGMPLLRASGYPVYAPSCIPAAGGKFRLLEGKPVGPSLKSFREGPNSDQSPGAYEQHHRGYEHVGHQRAVPYICHIG